LLAFSLGLLLAHDGGYPPRLVSMHRRLTFAAVIAIAACYVLWTRVEQSGAPRMAYRGLLGGSLLVLSVGAHFGGSLSRGDAYLFEFEPGFVKRALGVAEAKPAGSAAAPPQAAAEPLVYRDVVAPILGKY